MSRVLRRILVVFISGLLSLKAQEENRDFPESMPLFPVTSDEVTSETVKQYWIRSIPMPRVPSHMSSGYAYDMAFYREKLIRRNLVVQEIEEGTWDKRAECVALRHNLRIYREKSQDRKIRRAEERLSLLENPVLASIQGGKKAKSKHSSQQKKEIEQLQEKVRQLEAELARREND